MATQTTGGGSTTSFINAPQAVDDSYWYSEDWLSTSSLYNSSTKTVTLDVMSNDLGGNAKSLFSIDDGNGNTLEPDYQLLCKDVNAAGCSPWEKTPDGNWIRINNGKVEFKLGNPEYPDDHTKALDLNSLAAGTCVDDEFVYAIRLGNGTLSQATVRIHITGENDAVVLGSVADAALDDTAAADDFADITGTLSSSDADLGDTPTYGVDGAVASDDPAYDVMKVTAYGTLYLDTATGAYRFVPDDAAINALDSDDAPVALDFQVSVTDGDATDSDTLTITVTGANDDPVLGAANSVTTDEDLASSAVAIGATDIDGDTLSYSVKAGGEPAKGSVSFDQVLGTFVYTPDANENGADSFTILVSDGHGGTAEQVVSVTITPVNDAAVITGDDAKSITEDAVPNTVSGNLDSIDVDGVDDSWQAETIASENAYGSLTINADGAWTYTLDNTNAAVDALNDGSSPLTDTFTVKTADGTEHDIVVTINGHTDATDVLAPTDIKFNLNPGSGGFTGNGLSSGDILGSFTAVDADSATWTFSLSGPNSSLFSLSPSGSQSSVNIAAAGNIASGNYTFVVTATDPAGNSISETFHVGVGTTGGDGAAFFTVSTGTDVDFGLNGGDTINGGTGDDALVGGQNTDTLNGGLGNDQLIGGAQNDFFDFTTALNASTNVDTIFDFDAQNADKMRLDDAIFAAIGPTLTADEFVANAGGIAGDANDFILYDTSTGDLYYDADGSGGGAKILFAHLDLPLAGGTVDAADFSII